MDQIETILSRRAFIKWCMTLWVLVTNWNPKTSADATMPITESSAYGSGAYGQGSYPGEQHRLYLPYIKKGDD